MTSSFFITQSLGFFTQLFPCMILSLLSFTQDKFRLNRKIVISILSVYGVITSVIFPFLLKLPIIYSFIDVSAFGSTYMLGVIFLYIIFYIWLIKETGMKKILSLNMVIFYAATEYLLVNLVTPFLEEVVYSMVYRPQQLFLYVLLTVILFPIMAWLLGHWMKGFFQEIEPNNLKRGFIIIIIITFLYYMSLFMYTSVIPIKNMTFFWVFCPPFLLSTLVLFAFYWLMIRESIRRKRESEYLRNEKIQSIQYESLKRDIEKTARLRHDARHHYRLLYEMSDASDTEGMKKYLSELMNQVATLETKQYCENKTINGILQYYISWAKENGIECMVQAECGELDVSPIDLAAILGNTLENAIHACEKLANNKKISVQIGMVGCSLGIIVENSCDSICLSKEYKGKTGFLPAIAYESINKTGGYGLKNIDTAAQRYSGNAEFSYNKAKKCFITCVRINGKSNETSCN